MRVEDLRRMQGGHADADPAGPMLVANGDRLVVGATRTTPTRRSLQFWQHCMAGTIGFV
jgi:hypothetical protein